MKSKFFYYRNIKEQIVDVFSIIDDDFNFASFIFSDKKAILYYTKGGDKLQILPNTLSYILGKMIFTTYWGDVILLSKFPIPKNISYKDKIIGELLGIPDCCIKAYIEDKNNGGDSKKSYKRYQEQLKELQVIDPFEVNITKDGFCNLGLGFIPCSPQCKKAHELILHYAEDIKKGMSK